MPLKPGLSLIPFTHTTLWSEEISSHLNADRHVRVEQQRDHMHELMSSDNYNVSVRMVVKDWQPVA